jgi:hypothetical protein
MEKELKLLFKNDLTEAQILDIVRKVIDENEKDGYMYQPKKTKIKYPKALTFDKEIIYKLKFERLIEEQEGSFYEKVYKLKMTDYLFHHERMANQFKQEEINQQSKYYNYKVTAIKHEFIFCSEEEGPVILKIYFHCK